MDPDAGRDYDFWPISELPDIYLDSEFFMQTCNIMAILHRHIFIITRRNMRYELLRLLTFILYFPRNTRLDLRAFATAGFYYTRERDYVVCYRCGFCKRNWTEGDDPHEIHQRYSPVCDFFQNRGVNIPFFRIDEGGLRRLTETITVNERISPGPMPVIPADEIQQHILRLLGGTYPEINRRIVFSDRDYINAQPVVDLRQGRQLVENLNFVVNEISVTLSDLEINLRRDFLHSLTESESGVTLHSRPVRQNEHYQAISLGLSRRSNRSVTLEGVHSSTSLHSVHDLYTAEESEVQTEGRLLQEDNSDLYGVHSVERCFSHVSEQTGDCSRRDNCIPLLRGLMTTELNQDQNISYDSIEKEEIAYSSETDQTQLKTLCEPEMNVNHSVISEHSEQTSDNVSVLGSGNNKSEATIVEAPEETCRKALESHEVSTGKDNGESAQRVFSISTEGREKGYSSETEQTQLKTICEPVISDRSQPTSDNVSVLTSGNNKGKANKAATPEDTCRKACSPEESTEKGNNKSAQCVFINSTVERREIYCSSHQEAETSETSTSDTVISDGKDSDKSQFKALPRHNNKPFTATISSGTHDQTKDAADVTTSSTEIKAKAAATPEDTCRKALCSPEESTENGNGESAQRVFSNSTAEGGEFEFYFPSPQEAETGETLKPNTVVSDGKDSNNSQFKVLPRHNNEPLTALILSGAHDPTKDATDVTTSSTDIKAKAVEGREKGYSSETEQTPSKTICEPAINGRSQRTSDNVSVRASANKKGEAIIAAIPEDTRWKALDSPGDSTKKGNAESTQCVFSNLAERGEIPKVYFPSPQEVEIFGTATPKTVVSEGRDSNNAQFKVLPIPLTATISSEAQELKKDAADVITLFSDMTARTEQKRMTDASDKKRQKVKRDTCTIDNRTISNMNVARTTAGDEGFSTNKRIEHNEKRVNCNADIDLNGGHVATHNKEQTAIKFRTSLPCLEKKNQIGTHSFDKQTGHQNTREDLPNDPDSTQHLPETGTKYMYGPAFTWQDNDDHETLPMNADIPEGKKIFTVPFCPVFNIPDIREKDQDTSGFNTHFKNMEKNMPQDERSLTENREQKGLTNRNISEEGKQRIGTVVKEDFSNESQAAILHPSDHVDKQLKEKHSLPRPCSDSKFLNLKTGQTSGISLHRCRHVSADSTLNKRRNMSATPFQDVSPANWKAETDRSYTILLRNKRFRVAEYSNEDILVDLKQRYRIRDKPFAIPIQYFGKRCYYPDGNTKADDNDIAHDMRKIGFFSRKVLQKEELCSKSQESLGDESEESFGDESEQCSITEKINAQLCQQKKTSTSKTAPALREGSSESSDIAVDVSFNLAREQFNKIKDPRRKKFALTQIRKAISEAHTLEFTDTSD
ncbi:uncharacterized protein LOC128558540 isoform X2 [Mercenaria mercenaria]|uniref:uncharacterized protein LOC128558540 isoform X2 n=1 Tax=Mercenaria mercenaria TaxID=6596 RepID=UPI00234F3CD6|nr:uncharacterized protein LOC128558540 isoform X2 [Mercenaria mercenaria]